jgi:hypothetical protein
MMCSNRFVPHIDCVLQLEVMIRQSIHPVRGPTAKGMTVVAVEDFCLTKEQIIAKYPNGSPDYPTHFKQCTCSGCYASWTEWRSGYAGANAMRDQRDEAIRIARDLITWAKASGVAAGAVMDAGARLARLSSSRPTSTESAKGYVSGGRHEPGGMLDPNAKE